MMDLRANRGVTLMEMLVVLGVVMVLSTIAVTLAVRVENQSKENVLARTFTLLGNALEQFYDYEYRYPPPYAEFRFPLDCNGFSVAALQNTLPGMLQATKVEVFNHQHPGGREYDTYSGCEIMYWLLARVPEIRETLGHINPAFVTNKNDEGAAVTISIDQGPPESLLRVVDPWGTTLRYDYYEVRPTDLAPLGETKRTFPVLISAGPDRVFGTGDDISSGGKR
jgi:type II secretory pathway pseudopilin PulG